MSTAHITGQVLLAYCQEAIAAQRTKAAWLADQELSERGTEIPLDVCRAVYRATARLITATGRAAFVSRRGVHLRGQVAYDLLCQTFGVKLDLDERLGLPRATWSAGSLRVVALNGDVQPQAQRSELLAVSA